MKLRLWMRPSLPVTPMEPTSSQIESSRASACIAGSTGCSPSRGATGWSLPSLDARPAQYSGVAMNCACAAAAWRMSRVSTAMSCCTSGVAVFWMQAALNVMPTS